MARQNRSSKCGCVAACPADYTFSTWDQVWLEKNFKASLLTALPWVFLPHNVVVAKTLMEEICRLRSQGISFDVIASTRNERLSNR